MKIKNIQEFGKNISKTKIMQVGAVCLGTFLIANCALQTNEMEVANNITQKNEWQEPTYPYIFTDKKVIRDYEKTDGKYELNATFAENVENDLKIDANPKNLFTMTEDEISNSVIRGDFGNGEERKQRLEEDGYNYENVQSLVNLKCFNQDYTIYNPNCIYDPITMFSYGFPELGIESSIIYFDGDGYVYKKELLPVLDYVKQERSR